MSALGRSECNPALPQTWRAVPLVFEGDAIEANSRFELSLHVRANGYSAESHNISCHIMGARPLIAHIEKRLSIRIGERTPDNKFALEGVECIGACGMGPCMQIGDHLYENLTSERMDEILDSLRKDVVPKADTERLLAKGGE